MPRLANYIIVTCLAYFIPGVDWHANLRLDQNLITQGDLPRFVMDSYEECRGPPRLFLLDKYELLILSQLNNTSFKII